MKKTNLLNALWDLAKINFLCLLYIVQKNYCNYNVCGLAL